MVIFLRAEYAAILFRTRSVLVGPKWTILADIFLLNSLFRKREVSRELTRAQLDNRWADMDVCSFSPLRSPLAKIWLAETASNKLSCELYPKSATIAFGCNSGGLVSEIMNFVRPNRIERSLTFSPLRFQLAMRGQDPILSFIPRVEIRLNSDTRVYSWGDKTRKKDYYSAKNIICS